MTQASEREGEGRFEAMKHRAERLWRGVRERIGRTRQSISQRFVRKPRPVSGSGR